MAFTTINGLRLRYETYGSPTDPTLLMFAPGGFVSTIEMWVKMWAKVKPLETFSQRYYCIAYDRREAGQTSGRVERLTWDLYADEGRGLLDHLGVEKAFVIGGCMGCPVAMAFGVRHPTRTRGMILHWPTGGAKWMINSRTRLLEHAAFAEKNGLEAVVRAARETTEVFGSAPGGPWYNTIKIDDDFARKFVTIDKDWYVGLVRTIGPTLFDRDSCPGAQPEELMACKAPALIIPGADAAHAMSAARYLQEVLPNNQFQEAPVKSQPRQLAGWIMSWLDAQSGRV